MSSAGDRLGLALTGIASKLKRIVARALGLMFALFLAGATGLLTYDAVTAALGFVVGGGLIWGHAVVHAALERASWSSPNPG